MNCFDHVQDYSKHYMEKRLIYDPNSAKEIVKIIQDHTENHKGPFIDADAGLCLIAREYHKLNQNVPVIVLQKDKILSPLTDKLLKNYPDICVKDHNIINYDYFTDETKGSSYEQNSLGIETAEYKNSWENPKPSYTLFATVTNAFCKGLTKQCLDSWSKVMEVDNVFDHSRPEFFFMVSGRTYTMLCGTLGPGNYRLRQTYNYLFKILFDCECLGEYNENIYMPNGTGKKTKLYDMSKFYLLKVRPKLDIGIDHPDNFRPDLFLHFVETICSGKFMNFWLQKVNFIKN